MPSASLRNARIALEPTGEHARLGRGLDLMLALDEWNGMVIKLVLSTFRAGPAFGALADKRQDLRLFEVKLPF